MRSGPVAANTAIDPDDIVRAKAALSGLGLFRGPVRPFTDDALFDGIKTFQRRNGLRPDGVIEPDGPTARLMDSALFERANGSSDSPPLRLAGTVSQDAANNRDDTKRAGQALARTGFLGADALRRPGGPADGDLRFAIRSFQRDFNAGSGKRRFRGAATSAIARAVLASPRFADLLPLRHHSSRQKIFQGRKP